MRECFKSRQNTSELLTLMTALVFMGGWVRSLQAEDKIPVPNETLLRNVPTRTNRNVTAGNKKNLLAQAPRVVVKAGVPKDQVVAVDISSDGTLLAGGGFGKQLRIWDVKSNELSHQLDQDLSVVRSVAFQPASLLLAASDKEGVALWDVSTGQLLRTLRGPADQCSLLAFSPDGALIAGSAHVQGMRKHVFDIYVWKVSTGEVVQQITQKNFEGNHLAFSPDGLWLGSAINQWSDNSRETPDKKSEPVRGIRFWSTKTWEPTKVFVRDHGGSYSVAFSADGRLVADGGGYFKEKDDKVLTGEVIVWDIESGVVKQRLVDSETAGFVRAAFSPDGKSIAGQRSGRTFRFPGMKKVLCEVTLWDVETGDELWTVTLPFAPDPSPPVFFPDGSSLITRDEEAVRILDVDTGETIRIVTESKTISDSVD